MASSIDLNEPYNSGEEFEGGPQEHGINMAAELGDNNRGLPFDLNQDPPPPSPSEFAHVPQHPHHQPLKRLSIATKMEILHFLLSKATMGKLPVGTISETAQVYSTSVRTVSRIWKGAKHQQDTNQPYKITTNYHNCGRKRIQVQQELVSALGMGERSCIRDLASNIGMSKSACHRAIKRGEVRAHTNAMHPRLSTQHKRTRLEWVIKHLKRDTLQAKSEYISMFDYVHLDEKWFYLSKKSHRVYLAQEEKGKYRAGSSSKFIPKVMFTAVVARPRFDLNGQCTFDGKIGVFPFTYQEPAKRTSANRPRGTMITKLVERVNQKVSRAMLIDLIIPTIIAKWPQDGEEKIIYIQQDNATPHVSQNDPIWQLAHKQQGFTFILLQQPANSPDLNILDLGFFRSIQSLMHKKMPKDVDDMLRAVNEAFYELDARTLSNVWYTLQFVMNAILKCKGGNEYDIPHHNKSRLRLLGILPTCVIAPERDIIEGWMHLYGDAQENRDTQQQPDPSEARMEDINEGDDDHDF